MLDTEELDARWRDGLHLLATHIAAGAAAGASERVAARAQRRARRRAIWRGGASVVAIAAILAAVLTLTLGRSTPTKVTIAPSARAAKSAPVACKPVTSTVTIRAAAVLRYGVPVYWVKAGCDRVHLIGAIAHTVKFDPPGPSGPVLVSGDPKAPSSFAWTLRRGDYVFYCIIPGHRAAGMQATLKVR